MKKLSLRPYPGVVHLTHSIPEFKRDYKRYAKHDCPEQATPDEEGGMTVLIPVEEQQSAVFLVYAPAGNIPILAHEFGHVLLDLFEAISHTPTHGDGEPFCYLLGTLMEEALK